MSDDASMTSQNPPVPVLFLAGIGRSGTTLIERTLAEVPRVTALGEVIHLWDRGLVRRELCGCGQPFLQCPFWSAIGQSAFGGWDNVDTDRMAYLKTRVDRVRRVPALAAGVPRSLMEETDEYVAHFERLYRAAHDLVGGVLIDSSKQTSLPWCLRRSPGIDLRVIHCVRDSRGVAASWAKATKRPEAVSAEHELMPQFSPARISSWWTVHNTAIEPIGRRLPTIRMRYEDFVRDPRRSTRRMLELAGVEADDGPHQRDIGRAAGDPLLRRQPDALPARRDRPGR